MKKYGFRTKKYPFGMKKWNLETAKCKLFCQNVNFESKNTFLK